MSEEIKVTEQQLEEKELTAQDVCSSMIHIYGPRYAKGVENDLSGNAAKRLLKALVLYPLLGDNYKPTSEIENELFNMGDRLLQAKFTLMMHTLAEQAAENKELQQEPSQNNNESGENNGEVKV